MSATAATLTQEDHDWKPKTNPWLIAFVVSLAAFMGVLDTSIANVALPHIAGNLGASQDQHLGAYFLPGLECHRSPH